MKLRNKKDLIKYTLYLKKLQHFLFNDKSHKRTTKNYYF